MQLVDPETGEPFPDNQIPVSRMDPGSVSLLNFIPSPNVDSTTRNFHRLTTTDSVADNVNVRVTHTFTQPPARGAGPGGRGGAGRPGAAAGGRGGRGGRGNLPTTVTMNAQLQYRRNDNEQNSLFPTLGGDSWGSSLSTPVSVNITHRRTLHNVNVNFSRTTNHALGRYAYVADIAGAAGINGVATDPFTWGVPTPELLEPVERPRHLSPSPVRRAAGRLATPGRSRGAHTRFAPAATSASTGRSSRTDTNPRGTFIFTGLYSSGGSNAARGGGLDFADFLLGLPQQATLPYGPGNVVNDGRSMSLFFQDDWRKNAALTFNLGVRYEYLRPFEEDERRMVNLDVPSDFTAVAPVMPGDIGPFSGEFPSTLSTPTSTTSPHASASPGAPRARPSCAAGTASVTTPARMPPSRARWWRSLRSPSPTRGSARPSIRSRWRMPFERRARERRRRTTTVSPRITRSASSKRGTATSRATSGRSGTSAPTTPTRAAPASTSFARQTADRRACGSKASSRSSGKSSEGGSELHAGSFRLRRRPVKGIGFGASYTIAKSRDNASTIGGGGTVVAQDDQNLDAEWGLSSFDRRHQFNGDVSIEFPFGENRPWLNNGGFWAALLENWRGNATFIWQSGTPYTPRVQAAAADVARGTSNSLRANYNGESDPGQRSDDRPVLQHGGVQRPGYGHVRHGVSQHDHRPGQQAARRAVLA